MSSLRVTDRLLRHDRIIVAAALFLAVFAAAVFILAGGGTGMSAIGMTAHTGPAGALLAETPDMVTPMRWTPGHAMVIFIMWWLMMVAMMVPSAAPTILLYSALNRSRGALASLMFGLGYLAVWGVFSVLATAAQGTLAGLGMFSSMFMTLATPWLGAAVLVGAGLYQLTPIKAACLNHCRGPVDALTRHRRTGRAAAFRMGLLHGSFCLGCCWALMALLFVGGVMNVWWIIGITVYVAVEKLAPGGGRLARPVGVALVLAGLGVLLLGREVV
jgi:predicted metal-binding membrane protein